MRKAFNIQSTLLLVVLGLALTSCDKDKSELEVPATYEFLRDGVTTVSYSGQTTRIAMAEELASALLDFDKSEQDLLAMYANQDDLGQDVDPFEDADLNASTKSIKSKVAASKDFFSTDAVASALIKGQIESWITKQVQAVGAGSNQIAAPGVPGQIADGTSPRFVGFNGLEYNQAATKSLIGALMVDQMLNNYLSTAVLDDTDNISDNDSGVTVADKPYTNMEHKWDEAYGYLFGSSQFSAEPLTDLGSDNYLNKYLQRVDDDADFAGIAAAIFEAFKRGRAAIVAGDYDERDVQADIIKEKISWVIGIRAIYYLQQGKDNLPSEGDAYGAAFHDLSEGLGFVYSLRFTRKAGSDEGYFTADAVDSYMDKLINDNANGFWDLTPAILDEISEEIASKFDFTVAEAAK